MIEDANNADHPGNDFPDSKHPDCAGRIRDVGFAARSCLGHPATTGYIHRRGAVSVRDSGSRYEIQWRSDRVSEVHGFEAKADERTSSLAEWTRRTLGRKCPPGDPRPCHRTE